MGANASVGGWASRGGSPVTWEEGATMPRARTHPAAGAAHRGDVAGGEHADAGGVGRALVPGGGAGLAGLGDVRVQRVDAGPAVRGGVGRGRGAGRPAGVGRAAELAATKKPKKAKAPDAPMRCPSCGG